MEKKADFPIISSLNMGGCMTQEAVAKKLNLSTRQVRRIEKSALRKCAQHMLDHPENLIDMIFYHRDVR